MSLLAKALVYLHMQRFVAVEKIGLILYRRYVNDEWTKYLDALHACVKMRWQYVVPREQEDRALLRTLCEQTLEFENHFLMCYRTYLLSLLRSEDRGSQNFAIDQLGEAHYPDEEVRTALLTAHEELRF